MLALSQNQVALERLREEICSAFPDPSVVPSYDAVNTAMPYLNAVVKETLRVYPPVAIMFRISKVADVWPSGVTIPAGTLIPIFPSVLHQTASFWGEDAHQFRPERWLDQGYEKKDFFNFFYLVFSLFIYSNESDASFLAFFCWS